MLRAISLANPRLASALPLAAGVVAALIWLMLESTQSHAQLLRSSLLALSYWSALPLGALAMLLIAALTESHWSTLVVCRLETMARTMSLVIVFAIPMLLARASGLGESAPLRGAHERVYLSAPFFLGRAAVLLALWLVLATGLARPPSGRTDLQARFAAPGLIVLLLSITVSTIDWQISLEPRWFSTIYALIIIVGQGLQAWAFAIVTLGPALRARADERVRRDVANILLTLIVLWSYLSFMQYLIIWSGNLPDEVTWYQARTQGGWQTCVAILALFQFAAPLAALLFRRVKHTVGALQAVAALILVLRALEQFWLIAPAFDGGRLVVHASDAAAWCACAGFWLWLLARKSVAHA